MNCTHSSLQALGKVQKIGVRNIFWLQTIKINVRQFLRVCRALPNHKERFIYCIIAGDEKWSLIWTWSSRKNGWTMVNMQHPEKNKSDIRARRGLRRWNWQDIIHYKLLGRNHTVNTVEFKPIMPDFISPTSQKMTFEPYSFHIFQTLRSSIFTFSGHFPMNCARFPSIITSSCRHGCMITLRQNPMIFIAETSKNL